VDTMFGCTGGLIWQAFSGGRIRPFVPRCLLFRINSREFSEARTVGEQHDTRPPNVDSGINPSRIASFVVQKRASSPHFHNLQLHVNPSIGQPRTNQVYTSWTQRRTQRLCSPHNLCLNPRQQTSRARKR
jgi:hypothetical protein